MDYPETQEYLNSLLRQGIKLGLQNTERLLDYFDNPQLKVATVHIAGTNGKGSTAACIESILRTAGHRVGLYTSPHLLDFRERVQVNRQWISPEQASQIAVRIRKASEALQINPTYFEVGTLMAFLHFHESECDWMVIEVGMGGRLDSTNTCIGNPVVLTSISYDHQSSLGSNLAEIAGEKAGIMKPGGTVIAASQPEEVSQVFTKKAVDLGCTLISGGHDFQAERVSWGENGQTFDFHMENLTLKGVEIPLLGRYQVENASLAIATTVSAENFGRAVDEKSIRTGLKEVSWPGRLEKVQAEPDLVLDCAHNPDSVKNLTISLKDHFKYERCLVIWAAMADKDLPKMAEIIGDFADRVIVTRAKMERSADPLNLFKLLQNSNKVIEIIDEIPYALHTAQKQSGPADLILVTGSVFTVAEAKQAIDFQGTY